MSPPDLQQIARAYLERGFAPLPLRPKAKRPVPTDWTNLRVTADTIPTHFRTDGNIGVLNGEASNGLLDVDLDAHEALIVAPYFLPDTGLKFGRPSTPASHWCYQASPLVPTKKFDDPITRTAGDKSMLVELRGTGTQTMWPPSHHPGGEVVRFDCDGTPAMVDGEHLRTMVGRLAAAALLARHWPGTGLRHEAALALAGMLLRTPWDRVATTTFVEAVVRAAGDEEWEARLADVRSTDENLKAGKPVTGFLRLVEIIDRKVVTKVCEWLDLPPAVERAATLDQTDDTPTLTDCGNARRFVAGHGADLRYTGTRGWFVWDGRRWVRDEIGRVEQGAKETVKRMYADAAILQDSRDRPALARHATRSESAARVKAMIEMARTEPEVRITEAVLDRDPYLLNVLNGTLDLRTGALRPHRREDLLTKLAPVRYDPLATSPVWEAFIERILPDPTLRAFVQRVMGYALTGDTSEEKLFFLYGPAATGKSTFLEAIKAVLGDYGMTADFETFLARPTSGSARNDIARLVGARLVTSVEVEDGQRLAAALVKQLTGGDTITARFLYQEEFEFKPQFKLFLAANHRPQVREDDTGLWRRLIVIPFKEVISPTERNPRLKLALQDPEVVRPAILAWLIQGEMDRRRLGLTPPDIVEEETQAYRDDMDPLRDFITDRCDLRPEAVVLTGRLREEYERWCAENGQRYPLGPKKFAESLRGHGCVDGKTGAGGDRVWRGIGLRSEASAVAQSSASTDTDARREMQNGRLGATGPGIAAHAADAMLMRVARDLRQ